MKKIIKNKKAGFAQPVIDYYATVVIVFIITIFFIIISLSSGSKIKVNISDDTVNVDSFLLLENYLNSEVAFNNDTLTFAEVFDHVSYTRGVAGSMTNTQAFSRSNSDYYNNLVVPTKEYLDRYYQVTGCVMKITVNVDNVFYDEITSVNTNPTPECRKRAQYFKDSILIPAESSRLITVGFVAGVDTK